MANCFIKILILLFLQNIVFASQKREQQSPEKERTIFQDLKQSFYEGHGHLSTSLLIATNWIDSFFGDKKSLEEKNGTRLRVYYIASKEESSDFTAEPAFKLDLKLPNLQKKLQISFEKSAKSEKQAGLSPENKPSTDKRVEKEEVRGSISLFLNEVLDFDLKFTTGVKANIPPRLFSNFRISREYNIPGGWTLRTISNTFWEQVPGFGQSLTGDFERTLSDNLLLRVINESTWLDESDEITASHGPTLFQRLSSRRVVSYNIRANYTNRPQYQLDAYVFNLVYRQNISKGWLFYEIVPTISFPRSYNFKSRLALAAKIECLIGDF